MAPEFQRTGLRQAKLWSNRPDLSNLELVSRAPSEKRSWYINSRMRASSKSDTAQPRLTCPSDSLTSCTITRSTLSAQWSLQLPRGLRLAFWPPSFLHLSRVTGLEQ